MTPTREKQIKQAWLKVYNRPDYMNLGDKEIFAFGYEAGRKAALLEAAQWHEQMANEHESACNRFRKLAEESA